MNNTLREFIAAVALVACGFIAAKPFARACEGLRVKTHYAPFENLEHIDVALISRATRTLDITAYVLTDVPVIDALTEAGRRGVKLRLYRDANERQPTVPVAAAIDRLAAAPNVETRFKASDVYMHLKSYCIDGRMLRTGAANFSASGLKRQENDLVIIEGKGACTGFNAAFETMWRAR